MMTDSAPSLDFVRQTVSDDLQSGVVQKVITRFPPEPNGYLHIGHAKSICLNFGIAKDFEGNCHLRFDDTNPSKEDEAYVRSITEDVKWLGWEWAGEIRYASDGFEQMYVWACELIQKGLAYVDDQNGEDIRLNRGGADRPGNNSPFRDRSVEENLSLFEKMRQGEFEEGHCVLRAKIDMAHPNLLMRDPLMYRISKVPHHRTGSSWSIYPLYDWAHGLEDSMEGVTHSVCTLEFETHRLLYDWFLDQLSIHHPKQIEFARLNLDHTVMSKRKLLQLVEEGHVDGWDDPRLPTLSGLRRRGFTPEAIRQFCEEIGVSKVNGTIEVSKLESCLRADLNKKAPRVMSVLDPVKVVIDNFPEGETVWVDAVNNPEDPDAGTRKVPFTKELYIERNDFMENPPRKYFRMSIGKEVRLRYGFYATCTSIEKDSQDHITVIHCDYDPETQGGRSEDGRKVKGTIHWVSASHALEEDVNLYHRLFEQEAPGQKDDWLDELNTQSLESLKGAKLEPSLESAQPGTVYQFERLGYFILDSKAFARGERVWNRTATLKDSWSKQKK
jgi:glutaminyl-tRNA synthetase